jgi:hypothetical protein
MTPQLIKKYQDAIQAYVDLVKKSKGIPNSYHVRDLFKSHLVCAATATHIERMNITKRISRGQYQIIIDKIEPIHARRLLEFRQEYMKSQRKIKKNHKASINKESIKLPEKEKSLSFFWGLFKIKY